MGKGGGSGRPNSDRAPRSKEELEQLPFGELVYGKFTEAEEQILQQIKADEDIRRAARALRLREEQKPILADLAQVGIVFGSVWDLVNRSQAYPEAIPVLLDHLVKPYSDKTREGIARALAVPEPRVRAAWATLVAQYKLAPMGRGLIAPGDDKEYVLAAKDGLACALAAAATSDKLDDIIELLLDPTLGTSRILLLCVLRRSKQVKAKEILAQLASDPILEKEIRSYKSRSKTLAPRA